MKNLSKKKIIIITFLVVVFAMIGMDIYKEISINTYDQANIPSQQATVKTEEKSTMKCMNICMMQ
ncbi:hypothetical protein [Intestinibacter sp.]|uniref:hypothetical protein n=1 Tax=Intestinibacter sp. TaxID=1965304 RepID=UPI003F15C13B